MPRAWHLPSSRYGGPPYLPEPSTSFMAFLLPAVESFVYRATPDQAPCHTSCHRCTAGVPRVPPLIHFLIPDLYARYIKIEHELEQQVLPPTDCRQLATKKVSSLQKKKMSWKNRSSGLDEIFDLRFLLLARPLARRLPCPTPAR